MSETCPNCGAASFTDQRTDNDQITCYNCGEDFDPIPSEDDGEEDPDLEDPDIED